MTTLVILLRKLLDFSYVGTLTICSSKFTATVLSQVSFQTCDSAQQCCFFLSFFLFFYPLNEHHAVSEWIPHLTRSKKGSLQATLLEASVQRVHFISTSRNLNSKIHGENIKQTDSAKHCSYIYIIFCFLYFPEFGFIL